MSCKISSAFVDQFIVFTRSIYGEGHIPLHRPVFNNNEKLYLNECIDSNFVSSIGARVNEFENKIQEFVGSRYAIATVNCTSALHIALLLAGVDAEDEVITQALTFVGTCNPISYIGAQPVFIDVDIDTMGLSPESLNNFLSTHATVRDGNAWNRKTGRRLAACVPMHTFGNPCRIEEIVSICNNWGIRVVEDAAESLGSYVGNFHTGTFGIFGVFSFNGNKIITTGGGGMIVTDDEYLACRAKHRTTTSRLAHPYEFVHDEIGYNYRLPNINAALGCAQMEGLARMIDIKSKIHQSYSKFFDKQGVKMAEAFNNNRSNYWLNAILLDDRSDRDFFLKHSNDKGVMTRPVWRLMSELQMFKNCQHDGLKNSIWLQNRVVNIPSSVPDVSICQ